MRTGSTRFRPRPVFYVGMLHWFGPGTTRLVTVRARQGPLEELGVCVVFLGLTRPRGSLRVQPTSCLSQPFTATTLGRSFQFLWVGIPATLPLYAACPIQRARTRVGVWSSTPEVCTRYFCHRFDGYAFDAPNKSVSNSPEPGLPLRTRSRLPH